MLDFTDSLPNEDITLEVGDCMRLQFGQLMMEIERQHFEWTISHFYWQQPVGKDYRVYGEVTHLRYVLNDTDNHINISPRLADRPVVSRPHSPINLMHRGHIRVYVSTPLSLQVSIAGQQLLELPSVRLSDTWFGERTGPGELCYADSTRARLNAHDLKAGSYKVSTPIDIRNMSGKALRVDRINVPLPLLSLYRSTANPDAYSSAALTVTLGDGPADTEIEIEDFETGKVAGKESFTLITAARKPHRKQLLHRALNLFLG